MTNPLNRSNSPAGKVLALLRYGPSTVDEIGRALGLTQNAIRNQLRKLVGANLVARTGRRPGPSKPSVLYQLTPEGQIHFSRLYVPVLSQFLRVAENRCSGEQLASFLLETGRSLAAQYPKPRGGIRRRVDAATRFLNSVGGLAEVQKGEGALIIRSRGCPLSVLTRENSEVCHVVESLIAEYVSAPVKVCCTYGDEPRCCFEVAV